MSPSLPREQYLAALADGMSEDTLLAKIRDAVKSVPGVLIYHTHDSRRSERGFPDLVLVIGTRVLYRELKTMKGRVSVEQRLWLERLTAAGQDADVWRPSHWVDGTVTSTLTSHLPRAS